MITLTTIFTISYVVVLIRFYKQYKKDGYFNPFSLTYFDWMLFWVGSLFLFFTLIFLTTTYLP